MPSQLLFPVDDPKASDDPSGNEDNQKLPPSSSGRRDLDVVKNPHVAYSSDDPSSNDVNQKLTPSPSERKDFHQSESLHVEDSSKLSYKDAVLSSKSSFSPSKSSLTKLTRLSLQVKHSYKTSSKNVTISSTSSPLTRSKSSSPPKSPLLSTKPSLEVGKSSKSFTTTKSIEKLPPLVATEKISNQDGEISEKEMKVFIRVREDPPAEINNTAVMEIETITSPSSSNPVSTRSQSSSLNKGASYSTRKKKSRIVRKDNTPPIVKKYPWNKSTFDNIDKIDFDPELEKGFFSILPTLKKKNNKAKTLQQINLESLLSGLQCWKIMQKMEN